MASPGKDLRQEVADLLQNLYKEYMSGRLGLHKDHLTDDVVLLGPGDPRVIKGKEAYLDYLRKLSQKAWLRKVKTRVEDVKLLGDMVIVAEVYTSQVHIRGKDYQETGRTTAIVVYRNGKWHVTHMHMETLARNRIVV